MMLLMVVTLERASCCTLVLRTATPNSWPLITPVMLPQLPRGSPERKENNSSDMYYPPVALDPEVLLSFPFHEGIN
jgi:hypothetical protein